MSNTSDFPRGKVCHSIQESCWFIRSVKYMNVTNNRYATLSKVAKNLIPVGINRETYSSDTGCVCCRNITNTAVLAKYGIEISSSRQCFYRLTLKVRRATLWRNIEHECPEICTCAKKLYAPFDSASSRLGNSITDIKRSRHVSSLRAIKISDSSSRLIHSQDVETSTSIKLTVRVSNSNNPGTDTTADIEADDRNIFAWSATKFTTLAPMTFSNRPRPRAAGGAMEKAGPESCSSIPDLECNHQSIAI